MINVQFNKGEVTKMEVKGDVSELGADILTLTHSIFMMLLEEDMADAFMFKMMLNQFIDNACSPITDEEREGYYEHTDEE